VAQRLRFAEKLQKVTFIPYPSSMQMINPQSQIYQRQLIVPLLFSETITLFPFSNLQSKIKNPPFPHSFLIRFFSAKRLAYQSAVPVP
jgi:hypothetical protein